MANLKINEMFIDVSVVIPAFQAQASIKRALESVLKQTVLPREIIVVDDGSTDNTADEVSAWIAQYSVPKLQLFRQENLGAGAARNKGVKFSSGKYIAFLDADDEWETNKLEKSIEVIEKTGASLVSHDYLKIDGAEETFINCEQHFNQQSNSYVKYFLRGYIATSTVLVLREVFVESGGFDPSLLSAQDYELWLTIIALPNIKHVVFSGAFARYHVTPLSITSNVKQRYKASLRILYQHLPELARHSSWSFWVAGLRSMIICLQAVQGYLKAGKYFSALAVTSNFWVEIIKIMFQIKGEYRKRPNFMSDTKGLTE